MGQLDDLCFCFLGKLLAFLLLADLDFLPIRLPFLPGAGRDAFLGVLGTVVEMEDVEGAAAAWLLEARPHDAVGPFPLAIL
eukprot:6451013-Heterocapsa_arctica.AAC.1